MPRSNKDLNVTTADNLMQLKEKCYMSVLLGIQNSAFWNFQMLFKEAPLWTHYVDSVQKIICTGFNMHLEMT